MSPNDPHLLAFTPSCGPPRFSDHIDLTQVSRGDRTSLPRLGYKKTEFFCLECALTFSCITVLEEASYQGGRLCGEVHAMS